MDGNSVKKSDIFSKLKDKNLIVSNGYINGIFTSGEAKKTFDVKDPSNGDLIISLPDICLLYTSPSPRDNRVSRMPSSA